MSMMRTGSVAGAALAVLAALSSASQAAPISAEIEFATSGQIGQEGVTGAAAIGYNSVAAGALIAPDLLNMGSFQVAALPTGVKTTYVDTPFSVSFLIGSIGGQVPTTNETPIVLTGRLNGAISGSSGGVFATFDPIPTRLYQVGPLYAYLSPIAGLYLMPGGNGQSTVMGELTLANAPPPPPVPEPTSILGFAALAAGGFAWRRRSRAAA